MCVDLCVHLLTTGLHQVLLWRQGGCEGGGGDCGEGWGVMSPPLECTHPVTALDFSPSQMSNGRCVTLIIIKLYYSIIVIILE